MNENIKYIKGNIFTSKCQTLVNTVNCVGIMGAGIALEFKYRYPDMFDRYVKYCHEKLIQVGKLWIYDVPNSNNKILNFPTKNDWKFPSKYEYLEKGLNNFLTTYREKRITSIAFPLLGAQNGGLDPNRVQDLMYTYFIQTDIPIEIYEYDPLANDGLIDQFRDTFIFYTVKELEKLSGLNKNAITKLKSNLEKNDLNSLIQLNEIKGMGKETIKSCFQLAMQLKIEPKQRIVQKNIYDENNDKQIISKIAEPETSSYEQTSKKDTKGLTLTEKIKLTGLSEQIISHIEKKHEDVSIKDLKAYCKALKLNFKDFILKNYFPKRNTKRKTVPSGATLF